MTTHLKFMTANFNWVLISGLETFSSLPKPPTLLPNSHFQLRKTETLKRTSKSTHHPPIYPPSSFCAILFASSPVTIDAFSETNACTRTPDPILSHPHQFFTPVILSSWISNVPSLLDLSHQCSNIISPILKLCLESSFPHCKTSQQKFLEEELFVFIVSNCFPSILYQIHASGELPKQRSSHSAISSVWNSRSLPPPWNISSLASRTPHVSCPNLTGYSFLVPFACFFSSS